MYITLKMLPTICGWQMLWISFTSEILRATSYTRLRARDHYISSTLIGGRGGASPSLFHTTLEGLTKYVNARWM